MPPKNKKSPATSKMAGKDLGEQETPFAPVPYETTDVRTSITLLLSSEKDIVIRALNVLAKYADKKDLNVVFLYKNGIVVNLLQLVAYSDLTILRFTLKLLGQIVSMVPEAARELSFEQYDGDVKQINYLFMKIEDPVVREFCTQFLSCVVKSPLMASYVLRMGTVVPIFAVLKTTRDPDTQLNTLRFFGNILEAREAIYVLPSIAEFAPRTILCYLKNKIPEIRDAALNVVEKLTSWRSEPMQALLKQEQTIEVLFRLIFNNDYKALHKRAFNVILTCTDCLATATYFVKSVEFVQFCEWAKFCPKKCILPTATILTALTRQVELRQILFDFSVEDSVLSFFRTENELVFYKTCEAICNMSSHRYCCRKMVTPVVIECLIGMLNRRKVPIIPYHEIALTTLCKLMKRDPRTMDMIVRCSGLDPIMESLLRDKQEYTENGISTLMEILYIFSANIQHKCAVMNCFIYDMLLKRFEDPSEYSQKALLILDQYVDVTEYRQYFVEFKGPEIVMQKITSTPNEQELKNILVFLQRIFVYKKIGMVFLWGGCLQLLENVSDEVKEAVPLIGSLIGMMYDLYLPLKFHKLGRLEITDHFTNRFYMINGHCTEDFPFLEIVDKQQVCPINVVYIVDFSANVEELTTKTIIAPSRQPSVSSQYKAKSPRVRTSILKSGSGPRSPKVSIQLNNDPMLSPEERKESLLHFLTCRVPPPINFGSISEDPYLPQYVEKLRSLLYNDKKYILCFQHQVKLVATFIRDVLSGPEEASTELMNQHCLDIHIKTLRDKLGTNLIPLGYLRYGFYCERALLFKALAEKLGIPATLVRGRTEGKNNLMYWNEVPLATEEPYIDTDDQLKTHLTYSVVDLIHNVGNLMLVGSLEANKYCGLLVDED